MLPGIVKRINAWMDDTTTNPQEQVEQAYDLLREARDLIMDLTTYAR